MGETTARYFRDKLAMRARAKDRGIAIPEFVHVLNHAKVHRFLATVPAPWLLKPRSEASSVGITKFDRPDDVWKSIEELGDLQSNYLIERMIPGDVFHVDSIVSERKMVFAETHGYRKPLFELIHQGGGIFATRTVRRGSEVEKQILDTHAQVIEHLGLVRGVTHTEFIRGRDDGKIYFLETSARVGGAHIAELVEASTGLNPWKEWAKIEILAGRGAVHSPPAPQGLRRAHPLALAAGAPGHLGVRRPRDRLAPRRPPSAPRRPHRPLGQPRAGRGAARSVRAPDRPGLHGDAACADRSHALTAVTSLPPSPPAPWA